MKVSQRSGCSILALFLLFILRGSHADNKHEVVHKAVGDSLDLTANFSKDNLEVKWTYNGIDFAEFIKDYLKIVKPDFFQERLKPYKNIISVRIEDLKLQDSGKFSIVAERSNEQLPTKFIELHVHDPIKEVQIKSDYEWKQSQNICVFHLTCRASGDVNPSYSWSRDQIKSEGPQLNFSLILTKKTSVSCTANNTVSYKSTTEPLECKEKYGGQNKTTGDFPTHLLIAVGAGIVVVVILSGTIAVCYKCKKNKGRGESETGITVYEDVDTEGITKKRTESVVNGMSIYETVDDTRAKQNTGPQTLYDKINYQRHPVVSPCVSSPYQEVK